MDYIISAFLQRPALSVMKNKTRCSQDFWGFGKASIQNSLNLILLHSDNNLHARAYTSNNPRGEEMMKKIHWKRFGLQTLAHMPELPPANMLSQAAVTFWELRIIVVVCWFVFRNRATNLQLMLADAHQRSHFLTLRKSRRAWFIFLFLVRAVKQMKRADLITATIKTPLGF